MPHRRRITAPSTEVLHREVPIRILKRADDGDGADDVVRFSASSQEPVMRVGDQEILRHDEASVRMDRLRTLGALLVNHDPDQRAASIVEAVIEDGRLVVGVRFGQGDFALQIRQEVEDGILRGVSVGYCVHVWEIDDDARTMTAIDWEPYEVSLTPIPADATVGVGRSDEAWQRLRSALQPASTPAAPGSTSTRKTSMNLDDLLAMFPGHRDLVTKLHHDKKSPAEIAEAVRKVEHELDERQRAEEIKEEREEAALAKRALELRELADSHGIDVQGIDLRSFKSTEEGLRALLERKAGSEVSQVRNPVGGTVLTVTGDGMEKRLNAVEDGFRCHGGLRQGDDLGMRRHSPLELVREILVARDSNCRGWTKDQLIRFATRDWDGLHLRDANQIAADFTNLLKNAFDKVVMQGYNSQRIVHGAFTSERLVDDFKTVDGAALVTGLLAEQEAKGMPFEEAEFVEKSYSAALGLFGRTAKLTYQDWRNDDLGEFANAIRFLATMAGVTEDYLAFKELLGATWTDYQTSSAAFYNSTDDKIDYDAFDKVVADLENRQVTFGGVNVPIHPVANVLIVPPRRKNSARAVTGQAMGADRINAQADTDWDIVSSPWLQHSAITGNSADNYYVGDKTKEGVKVLRDRLNPMPTLRRVEAGATPDLVFMVMHAFKAKLASQDPWQKGVW